MSYASGMMMGVAIGRSIMSFLKGDAAGMMEGAAFKPAKPAKLAAANSQPHIKKPMPFHKVSAQAGRRRYRATFDKRAAEQLEGYLAKISWLKKVEINPLTGSLLFIYDAKDELRMDDLELFLKHRIFHVGQPPKLHHVLESHAGALTKSIRGSVRDFSHWLKKNTAGWLDASSLASTFFFVNGVRKMILTQQFPSGSQMLWWAISLMRGWRTV